MKIPLMKKNWIN